MDANLLRTARADLFVIDWSPGGETAPGQNMLGEKGTLKMTLPLSSVTSTLAPAGDVSTPCRCSSQATARACSRAASTRSKSSPTSLGIGALLPLMILKK
jgi:hypothetical protein